jgi:hypothetical protein|tara:strand:+ start:1272 stop:1454 length:183 start_codon:yes stop_codon:yes gene_type:complete
MSETTMSEYIKGFDHGCDYIVAEIERFALEHDGDENILLRDLIDRLKMQGKYDLGKVPTK